MAETVRIEVASVPDWAWNSASRIISKSIRSFFADPENRRGYEEWLKTPEGRAALERDREDREKRARRVKW